MKLIFIFVFMVGILYFIIKSRKVDFFCFAFVASGFYFFPAFFGFVRSPISNGERIPIPISNEAYLIYIAILLLLIFGAIIYDISIKQGQKIWIIPNDKQTFKVLIYLALLVAILFIVLEWNELISYGKPDYGRIHPVFQIITGLGFAYTIANKKWKIAVLLGFFMIVDLYGGNREGFILSVFAGVLLYITKYGRVRIIKYWKIILGLIIISVVFIIYKGIYVGVQMGDWELVIERLTDKNYWNYSFTTMEPFSTQNVLNQTIMFELTFPMLEWLKPILHNLIIFAPALGAESMRYSDYFMNTLYPGLDWGMASNIWAEGYAVGGLSLVLLLVIFYSIIFPWIFNFLFNKSTGFLRLIVAFSGCYFFFFIHRTGLNYMVSIQKRILLSMIFISIVTWFWVEVINRKKQIQKKLVIK